MGVTENILYIDEHFSCKSYRLQNHTGFRYIENPVGHRFGFDDTPFNYIFCVLEGACTLSYSSYIDRTFVAGDVVLIPRTSSYHGVVTEAVKVVVFGFDLPQNNCDKIFFEVASKWCQEVNYDFRPIPLLPPLRAMLTLLVDYLQSGLDCGHLHEIKHREFFILLRGYYSKLQLAELFYPIMGQSYDFKNSILKHYTRSTTISQLIELIGVSRSVFFTQFKEEFGVTPKKWIADKIKQDLVHLASNPKLSTKEIQNQLDFHDRAQFNRFCQTNYGCSPSQTIAQIRAQWRA